MQKTINATNPHTGFQFRMEVASKTLRVRNPMTNQWTSSKLSGPFKSDRLIDAFVEALILSEWSPREDIAIATNRSGVYHWWHQTSMIQHFGPNSATGIPVDRHTALRHRVIRSILRKL